MLKVLSNTTFNSAGNAKCGEIYCQSSTDFTIVCGFCELKCFEFEDFLLHFRNIHFEVEVLQSDEDVEPMLDVNINVKNEIKLDEDNIGNESITAEDIDAFVEETIVEEEVEVEDTNERLMNWQGDEQIANYDSWKESEEEYQEDHEDNDVEYRPQDDTPKTKKSFKEYKCETCEKIFVNLGLLKLHNKREHQISLTTGIKCKECDEIFAVNRQLEDHALTMHGGLPCPMCNKRLTSLQGLGRHKLVHNAERSYICNIGDCRKGFLTPYRLKYHKRSHNEESKCFVCDVCGYRCHSSGTLKVHYRIHTGEKPFVCDTCNKRFASSSLLGEHKQMHSTDRPHKCDVCGAAFSRQKALYHHKHLHSGVKEFKCRLCGNAYAQMAGLAGHMRKHREGLLQTTVFI